MAAIDIRDLMLEAQAEVGAVMRDVVREMMEPQIMAQLKATWVQLPDVMKEQFKRERPQEYAELMSTITRGV